VLYNLASLAEFIDDETSMGFSVAFKVTVVLKTNTTYLVSTRYTDRARASVYSAAPEIR
jgi:hypothetical protein